MVGDRAVIDADLDQLEYTTQVVNEALRLFPSGHTIVRHACRRTSLAGHAVEPGRIVAVSVWGIHHNPHVWTDPERFDPGRFDAGPADEGPIGPTAAQQRDRYSHLPFGGGPRGCIGQHLAMAELVVAVATVVRAFRLESLTEEVGLDVGATLRPRGALPCRIRPVP